MAKAPGENDRCGNAGEKPVFEIDAGIIRCEMQGCGSNCNGLCLAGAVNINALKQCERFLGQGSGKCRSYKKSIVKFCMTGKCRFNKSMNCAAGAVVIVKSGGLAICAEFEDKTGCG